MSHLVSKTILNLAPLIPWMELEAANRMVFKAASLYDTGKPCGTEANAAKYLAGEAG